MFGTKRSGRVYIKIISHFQISSSNKLICIRVCKFLDSKNITNENGNNDNNNNYTTPFRLCYAHIDQIIYTYMLYIFMHSYAHVLICAHIHIRIYLHALIYKHAHIHICAHIYIHIYIHFYTF